MHYTLVHETPYRIRVLTPLARGEKYARALEELLADSPSVAKCEAYPRIGSIAVWFEPSRRSDVMGTLDRLRQSDLDLWEQNDSLVLTPRPRQLIHTISVMATWHILRRLLLPAPIRVLVQLVMALPFWARALRSLCSGQVNVPVLDGAAIAMGFTQDPTSAGSTMFLLRLGEELEDYTQRSAESSLVRSLLDIPSQARIMSDGKEQLVDIVALSEGCTVIARKGDAIPVDGEVAQGEALVNQSSLTGEPLAVLRSAGDSVYAGTVVEDGEVHIYARKDPSQSKIQSIATLIEKSSSLKSRHQRQVESIADKLVPWNFLLAGAVFLVTGDLGKTAATLMVDYSCALKISGSVAVMCAQKESADSGFVVKGSKHFETVANAGVLVFDKTGTLTQAVPRVRRVAAFDGYNKAQVLRLAACLEEHFPHPVACAVVKEAEAHNLAHRERHAEVEYIVAHGIASRLNGERVIIGSEHFVFGDEGVCIEKDQLDVIRTDADASSILYLAVGGELKGAIYIDDPLKEQVPSVIQELKAEGFSRVIMLTGDTMGTASRIAQEAGITEVYAGLLPEDKCRIVKELCDEGNVVMMVGDGVNDSPALAEASVSVAMGSGSALARRTADIALADNSLTHLVQLKRMGKALAKRMRDGYGFTIGFNSLLLAGAISGVLSSQLSSVLHNGATVAISAAHTRPLLPGAPPYTS